MSLATKKSVDYEVNYVNVVTASKRLGVTPRTIRNWVAEGMFAHIKVQRGSGVKYFIEERDIDRFINERREEPNMRVRNRRRSLEWKTNNGW